MFIGLEYENDYIAMMKLINGLKSELTTKGLKRPALPKQTKVHQNEVLGPLLL